MCSQWSNTTRALHKITASINNTVTAVIIFRPKGGEMGKTFWALTVREVHRGCQLSC